MVAEFLIESLRQTWAVLQEERVTAAIMDGLALSAWQHLRMTRDLDILVDIRSGTALPVIERLRKRNFRTRKDPPLEQIGELEFLPLFFEPADTVIQIRIDLFLARSEFHRQVLARRVPFQFPASDLEVQVVACEDLILLKIIAGRIIDRVDAAYLLRANRSTLDVNYLTDWCRRLNIEQDYLVIWNEAFSGPAQQ